MNVVYILWLIIAVSIFQIVYNFWLIKKRKKHDNEMLKNLRDIQTIGRNHQQEQRKHIDRIKVLTNKMFDEHHREIAEIKELQDRFIKEHFTVGVDINPMGYDPNYVVVVGRFRNVDYVRCFNIPNDVAFDQLIKEIITLEKEFGKNVKIDAPPQFKAVVKNK